MAGKKVLRRSVSLPYRTARRVQELARSQRTSASKVLLQLIEDGMESRDREKERFLALADALVAAKDPAERRRLKEELSRLTFGP